MTPIEVIGERGVHLTRIFESAQSFVPSSRETVYLAKTYPIENRIWRKVECTMHHLNCFIKSLCAPNRCA